MTEQPKTKYEIVPQFYKRWPDYDSWTAQDFQRLDEGGLRTILGTIAFKTVPAGTYVPKSFEAAYGENATYELTRVLLQEADRRGLPEAFPRGVLNGGMRYTFNISPDNELNIAPLTNVTLADGTVRQGTSPQILSYEMSQVMAHVAAQNEAKRMAGTYAPVTEATVDVPREAIDAIVRANPTIVPQNAGDKQIFFPIKDEAAYMAGYATRAGAHDSIAPMTINYNAASICGAQRAGAVALDPSKYDIDVALAWTAGYIQSDVDQMTPEQRNSVAVCPPAQTPNTGIAGGNGTSAAPTTPGGGNANKAAPQR